MPFHIERDWPSKFHGGIVRTGISEFHDRASTDITSVVEEELGSGTAILLASHERSLEVNFSSYLTLVSRRRD